MNVDPCRSGSNALDGGSEKSTKPALQFSCLMQNPFDVRVTRNRCKDDNHAKPVPRKKLPLTVLRLRTQRGTASVEPVGKVIERGRSKEKEIQKIQKSDRGGHGAPGADD